MRIKQVAFGTAMMAVGLNMVCWGMVQLEDVYQESHIVMKQHIRKVNADTDAALDIIVRQNPIEGPMVRDSFHEWERYLGNECRRHVIHNHPSNYMYGPTWGRYPVDAREKLEYVYLAIFANHNGCEMFQ